MGIVALIIAAAVAIWYYMILRGRKAVRAYRFLDLRNCGISIEEANMIASNLDFAKAAEFQPATMNFVQSNYGGSQLTMIAQARIAGFKE
jgi:hypothetical protein